MAMAFIPSGQRKPFDFAPEAYSTPGIGDGLPGARPIKPGMMFAGFNNPPPVMDPSRGIDRAPITTQPLDEALAPSNVPMPSVAPLPGVPPKKPGFFDKGGGWVDALGILGDALAGAAGQPPIYTQTKLRQRQQQAEWERQDALRRQDREWSREDQAWKMSQPQYFMSGRDRLSFNPVTGEVQTIYDAPADFEEYAQVLGLEPGTDEYDEAVQDFILRSNGPTAQAGRANLEGIRQDNRLSLEGVRQGNRVALRQMPTYSNLHPRPAAGGNSGGGGGNRPPRTTGNVYAPILAKLARGEKLTPGEQQVISLYGRGGRSGGKSGSSAGGMAGVPTVNSPAEAMKLPKGTRYRTPDGRMMVR